jgi:hypothetical protein
MRLGRAIAAALVALNLASGAGAIPVTGWLKDTTFGGGAAATLTAANTNSPILGSGASNNADNTAIYAPFPVISLANGERITLSGSAEMIGTAANGDFRWGLLKDDGAGAATAGWRGFLASAESFVWAKDPSGDAFATTTFASVAGGRGFQLGAVSEANGILFSPGNYNFTMSLERYGNEIDVRYALTNSASGFFIASPTFTETAPARLTFTYDRVGFLAGSALDADQVRFSGIDVSASTTELPRLSVHSSGRVFLTNPTSQPVDFTQYEVTSAAGALSRSGWVSLDELEQNDPFGAGWEEAGGSNQHVLGEINLQSSGSLTAGQSFHLGNAHVAGGATDLAFRWTPLGGLPQRGIVEYVQSGDFNRDLRVDAADYVVWRNQMGTAVPFGSGADSDGNGMVTPSDLTLWRSNFGAVASGAASGLEAPSIPEPGGIALSLVAAVGLVGVSSRLRKRGRIAVLCGSLLLSLARPTAGEEVNQVAGDLITFNTNGAWSWYMDERVIVDTAANKLLISTVADASGTGGAARSGDIDLVSHDLVTGQTNNFLLHDNLAADDHNSAALLVRPDGRYLAIYTKHNAERISYYRVSANPHDATSWGPIQTFDWTATPGSDFNATYSNLFYLPAEGRTYNFARANNRSPNMMLSVNGGSNWTYGGKLLQTATNVGYVNGYLKYACNGVDRIDFIATEHHPRDFNNNIYHGYIQGGQMYRSDGTVVDSNIFDNSAPNQTALTRVFATDSENGSQVYTRAWTTDLHVDASGKPYAIFTTRANDIPVNTNGYNDHRFWYARYDGTHWDVHQLAKAGPRLYTEEQDYTGLVALDPHDPNTLYMSTPIDPRDESDLGVHEIFKGVTNDGGANWSWTPITFNSQVDNLRPTVAIWDEDHTALVWLRGTYRSMFDFDLDVVGLTSFGPLQGRMMGDLNGDGVIDINNDFAAFVAAMYTNLSGLSADEAYAQGDLNGDFKNDAYDFAIFRQAYDETHGAGAFTAAIAALPEPRTLPLIIAAAILANVLGGMLLRRGRTSMS